MTTCPQCGTSSTGDASFCSRCGADLRGDESNAPTQQLHRPSAESVASGEQRLLEELRQTTLGEYEILGEIGRGGMAVVFLAHELSLDRRVAIKVMTPALTLMDSGIQERFKREARTAASLSHPHIIPVYAVRESPHLVYFIMKYIEGRSLESVMREVGQLPIPVVQTILNQAGGALGHAHRRGVVHRDIKPGNIMLDSDGWVVVTDFGIAKVAEAEALTMTGGMVGTPSYMSPEQCAGGEIGGASDQYSLGIVAYEMIAGRLPFTGETMVNLLYDHAHTPPPLLQSLRPDCPPDLVAAVHRMLEKAPTNRFPTIEDAVQEIGTVTDSKGGTVQTHIRTLVRRSSTQQLLEKFQTPPSPLPRTHASGAGASKEASYTPSTAIPQPSTDRPRRARRWAWTAPVVLVAAAGLWFAFGRGEAESGGGEPITTPASSQAEAVAPLVAAALEVAPLSARLTVGETTQLSATLRDSTGAPLSDRSVQWQSAEPSVASVSLAGLVTALSPGTAALTASGEGHSASVVVTVAAPGPVIRQPEARAAEPASLAITPPTATVTVGETTRLAGELRDASGASIHSEADIIWSSTDTTVARVSSAGLVSGIAAGTVRIIATGAGQNGSATVTVTRRAVTTLDVATPQRTLQVGETAQLTAAPKDDRGTPLSDRDVRWHSSDVSIASVSATGLVRATAPGSVSIEASSEGINGTVTLTVSAPPAPATPATPVVQPRVAIQQRLEAYRLAIESGDLDEVRAAYPGMTTDQERNWREFFGSVRDLRATFDVLDITVDDDTAVAKVHATYHYRADRDQNQSFEFQASFTRDSNGWVLARIR